jgi:hypothetical protein
VWIERRHVGAIAPDGHLGASRMCLFLNGLAIVLMAAIIIFLVITGTPVMKDHDYNQG